MDRKRSAEPDSPSFCGKIILVLGLLVVLSCGSAERGSPTGEEQGIYRVGIATDGSQANGDSFRNAISGDGALVSFQSEAENLVPGDTDGKSDVFAYRR